MLDVYNFCMLNVHLGVLLFMKFNVTENKQYGISHFICSLISIYTYSSWWNLFIRSKKKLKLNKNDKLTHIGGWRICIMQHIDFGLFFGKKTSWYLKWVNYKLFIYLLWTISISSCDFDMKILMWKMRH